MLKKSLLILAGTILFSGCSGNISSENNTEISEKNTASLTEKIENCKKSGFIDYVKTKNFTEEKQDTIISNLKKTENSEKLEEYFCSQNRAWRAYSAQNIHTAPELLWFFSHDEDEIVRQYLASNRKLPEEIAQKLTGDLDSVLYALARNPHLTEKVLQKILEKPANIKTQESLAYNRGTSENFQKILAERLSHVKALVQLAKNPEISENTRKILKKRNITEVNSALEF